MSTKLKLIDESLDSDLSVRRCCEENIMKELGLEYYSSKEYHELFNTMIDLNICENTAIGITNAGELLYIENKLMNNSSTYWGESVFYGINKEEFCKYLEQARARGYIREAIQKGKTTEEELKRLSE